MCGIIGYVGPRASKPLLVAGLERLEYRGYDSAGIAVIDQEGELHTRKRAGKLQVLIDDLDAARRRNCEIRGEQRHVGAAPPCFLGQRHAHPSRRAVAEEPDWVERLAGPTCADEHAAPGERIGFT